MAASLSPTQLSGGNPVYDKYYRQVDPSGSGRVAASDAALFLKRSGLADLVLGKIWDLADAERKGCLNKQQFFMALRLVACAQNGLEVAPKSLHLSVPPPKFHDSSSPLLPGGVVTDCPWVVKAEEKLKFDAIFDSLSPVGGMLTGDKVKPVLLNSKLPVDILGRVWELSDLDRDGMLDRQEFAVAMYLVYRALEGEPVPMSLPPPLVPPSKRKKASAAPVMPLLPSPPSVKDRSPHAGTKTLPAPPKPAAPSVGTSLAPPTKPAAPSVGTSLAPPTKPAAPSVGTSLAPPTKPAAPTWVVSPADKAKYDEVFSKTDGDMDGLVSGPEVRDIFLKTGLPSATLARIWELCDIGDMGKLTREQFALALHLINQKLVKGLEPPQSLTPEMIPPSDRLSANQNSILSLAADFSAIKELDSLSNEIVELQREKSTVEQEIKEKEESIRERTSEVQDLQEEVSREGGVLQRLQTQRQEVQEALEELDQQKSSLEEQLEHIRLQCSNENQLISSLQTAHAEQEDRICEYEEQLVAAREELLCLQEETLRLEEKVQAAREQLSPLQESVRDSVTQVSQVQQKLGELRLEERSVSAQLSWKRHLEEEPVLVNGSAGLTNELHQEDLHQGDLYQGDHPTELREEEPAVAEQTQGDVSEEKEEEEQEEEEEGRAKMPAEVQAKPDVFEDLYTSLSWPTDGLTKVDTERGSPTTEVVTEGEEPPAPSITKVTPPEAETEKPPQEESSQPPDSPPPPRTSPPSLPPQGNPPALPGLDFFEADPFTDHDPFKDDLFGKASVSVDPFGSDPFKGSDPFAADAFFKQSSGAPFPSEDPFTQGDDPFAASTDPSVPDLFAAQLNNTVAAESSGPDPFGSKPVSSATPPNKDPFSDQGPSMADTADPFGAKMDALGETDPFGSHGDAGSDPFSCSSVGSKLASNELAAPANDPFAPGGTTVTTDSDPDPFAAVFGIESFGGGFADFSALAKSNGADPFSSSSSLNKNLFQEDGQSLGSDQPPALPPKTGTPTRPPPPPPGKRSSINRTESSDSFPRRSFHPAGSGDFSSSSSSSQPAKDGAADPFAPSSPRHNARNDPDRFASFDKYPTEEDMIEWAKRESEREEKERVARLTQQEQEDLELAIALSKSQLS